MEAVCTAVASLLVPLGLVTPGMRAVAVAAAVTVGLWTYKPAYFFSSSGEAKMWSGNVPDGVAAETTDITWWMVALGVGSFMSLCV